MSGLRSRLRTAGAAALLTLVAVPVVPIGPASAVPGRCEPGKGVTVVVDYGDLGGGVVTACDPDGGGKPAARVVFDAGFSLDFVDNQPGFVCRVNDKPGETGEFAEDCHDTPPADRYWGLYWSDGDPASWTYASEGAGSLDVPDGGSIGWRFQSGSGRVSPSAPPTAAPKETPSPQPSPKPSPKPSKPPATPEPSPSSSAPAPSASVPAGQSEPSASPGQKTGAAGTDRPTDTGKGKGDDKGDDKGDKAGRGDNNGKDRKRNRDDEGEAPPGAEPSPSASPATAALSPASDEPLSDDGSSAVLTVVAAGAVLLLAGAAGVIAWRRRA